MACDVWRLRGAERHHPGGSKVFVDGNQLAGQKSGDFYSGEQHCADVGTDEVLDHYPSAISGRRGRATTHHGADNLAVGIGVRVAEGV